ncbi:sulfite exporter TauE/SafE family protein [Rhodopirellula halodulae]|uniref:sulfite exporter TauE/SafE family protein n=1 Tax=Rhodopirellula halodulae TaxID=2894198 RepID=UPI001E3B40CA|nr:sulfite exporter TauE/SafE family protein [Rhodopirellula sp. JC737]MCC9656905.1 sulfite exporter TauE/SafE family protein [Rhodopirellula sp. JC737]
MLLGGKFWIVAWFFVAALVYSSAGFGGGSTYTALLVLHRVDHRVLPMLSLACNLMVVAGSCWRFSRRQQMPWARCIPLVLGSIPMAWIGGSIPLDREIFVPLLSTTLIVAGCMLLLSGRGGENSATTSDATSSASTKSVHSLGNSESNEPEHPPMKRMKFSFNFRTSWQLGLGALLGLLAGLVGIGGGIFLSPVLHLTRWGSAREIAATSSLFILVNSIAGLIGQGSKHAWSLSEIHDQLQTHAPWWPWLLVSVLLGGQLGNAAASGWFSPIGLRRVTAVIVLAAGCRLAFLFGQ